MSTTRGTKSKTIHIQGILKEMIKLLQESQKGLQFFFTGIVNEGIPLPSFLKVRFNNLFDS